MGHADSCSRAPAALPGRRCRRSTWASSLSDSVIIGPSSDVSRALRARLGDRRLVEVGDHQHRLDDARRPLVVVGPVAVEAAVAGAHRERDVPGPAVGVADRRQHVRMPELVERLARSGYQALAGRRRRRPGVAGGGDYGRDRHDERSEGPGSDPARDHPGIVPGQEDRPGQPRSPDSPLALPVRRRWHRPALRLAGTPPLQVAGLRTAVVAPPNMGRVSIRERNAPARRLRGRGWAIRAPPAAVFLRTTRTGIRAPTRQGRDDDECRHKRQPRKGDGDLPRRYEHEQQHQRRQRQATEQHTNPEMRSPPHSKPGQDANREHS